MSKVFKTNEIVLEDLGQGVSRKVLAYDKTMMMVEVRFTQGAVGAIHTHPHEQTTYVISGAFDFTINGDVHRVVQGDTIYFTADDPHGTLCVEEGMLLDVFSPIRDEFLG